LSVIVSDLKMAKKIVKFNQVSFKLVKKYWPGPLTLVLEVPNSQPKAGRPQADNFQTLGLRISSNKLATSLVKKLGRPITATSANVSGRGECYSIIKVINQFRNKKYKPDLIIDAGKLPREKTSTIIQCFNKEIIVLRQGNININPKS